jgi:3-deoxy-D-manno-octulosonic-acid transferase
MLWVYRLVTCCAYWLCYPYGKRQSDHGSQPWKGRLGLISKRQPSRIWMHAASVGEVRVIGHLIEFLLKREVSISIHITTMTKAGFNTALKMYRSANVSLSYFPFDAVTAVRKTLDTVQPELIAVAETEIWPAFVCEASARKIPIILVNARMTAKAYRRYRWFRPALKSILNRYDRFFFKTEDDSQRYYRLGLEADRGVLAGDMKFDAPLVEKTTERVRQYRGAAGVAEKTFLFVAGSTRPGEEAIIANAYNELEREYTNLTVVIAPRHTDRVGEIETLLAQKGIDFAFYGRNPDGKSVIIVDRLGRLNNLYLAADLAFVGGTLVDIGGHNILEPVWAQCPVLFGPSLFNVRDAADYILKNNYGALVRSEEQLVSRLRNVLGGDIIYLTKKTSDLEGSPTATVGTYILDKLRHA